MISGVSLAFKKTLARLHLATRRKKPDIARGYLSRLGTGFETFGYIGKLEIYSVAIFYA